MPRPDQARITDPGFSAGRRREDYAGFRKSPSYAGYGLERPPGSILPPHPLDALMECVEALKGVAEETLQITELAPWTTPPFRGRMRCEHVRGVIVTPAAVNAAANAAALALLAALNATVPGNTIAITPPDPGTAAMPIFTIDDQRKPFAHLALVRSFGISVQNGVPEQLLVQLDGGTMGGLPAPPDPFISSHEVAKHQCANAIVRQGQDFVISVRNLDLTTPIVVQLGICYWIWPINPGDETKKGAAIQVSGFGQECS